MFHRCILCTTVHFVQYIIVSYWVHIRLYTYYYARLHVVFRSEIIFTLVLRGALLHSTRVIQFLHYHIHTCILYFFIFHAYITAYCTNHYLCIRFTRVMFMVITIEYKCVFDTTFVGESVIPTHNIMCTGVLVENHRHSSSVPRGRPLSVHL